MKNKKRSQKVVEAEPKKQTLANKVIVILSEQKNVTRLALKEILGVNLPHLDMTLTKLRKAGFKIFPSKGPGTPLKIAVSEFDMTKFMSYRRNRFLLTATRMIMDEIEIAEQFEKLSEKPVQLLKALNSAKYGNLQNSTDR